jgi:hypothetical protein
MIKRKSPDLRLLTGGQMRAARALLRWTAQDLADHTRLGVATIRRAEARDGPVSVTQANAETIIRILEAAGIELLNGSAPGARLHKKK